MDPPPPLLWRHLPLGLLLAAAVALVLTRRGVTDTFYVCDAGFELQVEAAAVRCYRAGSVTYRRTLPCAPPAAPAGATQGRYELREDQMGTTDWCVPALAPERHPATAPEAFPAACPEAFQLEARSGADWCLQRQPATVRPPATPVRKPRRARHDQTAAASTGRESRDSHNRRLHERPAPARASHSRL